MSSIGDSRSHDLSNEELRKEVRLLRKASERDREERDQLRFRNEDLMKRIDSLEDENAVLQAQSISTPTAQFPGSDDTNYERLVDELAAARAEIRRLNAEKLHTRFEFSQSFNDFFEVHKGQIEQLDMIKEIAIAGGFLDGPQAASTSQQHVPSRRPDSEALGQPAPKRPRLSSPPVKQEPPRSPLRVWNPYQSTGVGRSQGSETSPKDPPERGLGSTTLLPANRPTSPKATWRIVDSVHHGDEEEREEDEGPIADDDPMVLAFLRKANPPPLSARDMEIAKAKQSPATSGSGRFGAPLITQKAPSSAATERGSAQAQPVKAKVPGQQGVQNRTTASPDDRTAEGSQEGEPGSGNNGRAFLKLTSGLFNPGGGKYGKLQNVTVGPAPFANTEIVQTKRDAEPAVDTSFSNSPFAVGKSVLPSLGPIVRPSRFGASPPAAVSHAPGEQQAKSSIFAQARPQKPAVPRRSIFAQAEPEVPSTTSGSQANKDGGKGDSSGEDKGEGNGKGGKEPERAFGSDTSSWSGGQGGGLFGGKFA